jgi:hypothetical protein
LKALIVGLIGLCWLAGGTAPSNAQGSAEPKSAGIPETFKALRLDGNLVQWQKRSVNSALEITYRVLSGPQAFSNARNCGAMTGLDNLLAASGIASSVFDRELAAAFAKWEAVAGVTFRGANADERANILVGAQAELVGWAFTNVFYDAASSLHIKPILQALICLNPARSWKVGFDGNLKAYDLRYTLTHEVGHAIGLDHPDGPGQIMGYRYEESFRDLQPGDVMGAITLYGAPSRGGNTIASGPASVARR